MSVWRLLGGLPLLGLFYVVYVLVVVVYLIASVALAEPSAPAAAPPASAASAAPTVTSAPTPTGLALLVKALDTASSTLAQLGLALLTLFVIVPAVAVLAGALGLRMLRLLSARQLVIEDLEDGTGDADLKAALGALSHRLREQVARETRRLESDNKYARKHDRSKAPPPSRAVEAGIAELAAALKDSAPEPAKFVLALLASAFPARGYRVRGAVHLAGVPPWQIGLSTQISDLAGTTESRLESLFAARPPAHPLPPGPPPTPLAPPGSPPPAAPTPDPAHGLSAVGLALERAGLWKEARAKYESALEKNGGYGFATDALERVLADRNIRERGEMLLRPAGRWLAIKLVARAYIEQIG